MNPAIEAVDIVLAAPLNPVSVFAIIFIWNVGLLKVGGVSPSFSK